ncbi:MAG: rod shape-determining protein RodA [Candidatus Lloydbacteria bacterium RIFCSPHIGHO2_02_FULL_51_22]|uniref:Rod shape-determining protein RodA n=3 Tax=Candidatus Lloydiibacteriota TaxID=1817910 RepID=A0A1G2DAP2_9BACT|nr:MAG: rod shape-determining protein RodA [Candidatus Lloydbacteria bacterium RIFCSPHIGHO2_02_FULL_51_22]OGZ15407.1 MAG: rod shape-determining protein RodA [Candidatus Lloydbacteria bacterium RIFCSPLOWO2_02_FULL_51_11]OGZ16589.1 MAG: rod shape-determining protein RodA [Candidatus Lloydbacteria bacterium RIFCSPLOWO2_12_FULL_51_9]
MRTIADFFQKSPVDWVLFLSTVPLLGAGLFTMDSFIDTSNYFFSRQLIWIAVSVGIFFLFSTVDWRFLKRTDVLMALFFFAIGFLLLLFIAGYVAKGAQSWFRLGSFSFQPSDPVKLLVIFILAKYFSRRHIEIAHIRHILVSGFYVFVPFVLVFLQPDFGSAVIIFFIWLGMIMVSGVSKKHLALVAFIGALSFMLLWSFVFAPYQKDRILTFVNPLTDLEGAGYNARQSVIAVGSGGLFGKGVGFGTQSRLKFLPEYETDFIFAAFAEEWGFVGAGILFFLFALIMWRIIRIAMHGASNFETLFAAGFAIFLMSHVAINIGMNVGILPVTGIPLPFMSYGGSHLVTEFAGLGILMGMRRYARAAHREDVANEIVGV